MPSGKLRLYVALYPSGTGTDSHEERRYHWALLVGPKHESSSEVPGHRYHVKNSASALWEYEGTPIKNVRTTVQLLARILIAKVEDKARMERVLENVPIVQKDPSWRCRTWIINAVEALQKDGKALGTSKLDWDEIESTARKYVASKIDAGRYSERMDMAKPKPTWDMLEAKETAP